MKNTKVAIVGLGTVGTGVARLLTEQAERMSRHAGQSLLLKKAIVRDVSKKRDIDLPADVISTDLEAVKRDPEIRVVAQLIGGLEPARTIMLELLESGKDIVTANKALLAVHGPELFDRARELNRSIAFEAAVAGGIPIITNIGQCLNANQIQTLHGILNGTSNFIICEMEDHGADYGKALEKAQRRGYAEADPSMDVDGSDAAQKLAILAHLAFGARVDWTTIPCDGIDKLEPEDIAFARELGYRIKLLAVAQLTEFGLELHVSPTFVRIGRPLAEVSGAFNAISVVGDAVGRVFFHGQGAGQMPTASAVVADLIDSVIGRTKLTFNTLDLWSQQPSAVTLRQAQEVPDRFYLRFLVKDHPGVMSKITGILGAESVSIASVIQHESPQSESVSEDDGNVQLVIMTHKAPAGAVAKALKEIDELSIVQSASIRMRVLD